MNTEMEGIYQSPIETFVDILTKEGTISGRIGFAVGAGMGSMLLLTNPISLTIGASALALAAGGSLSSSLLFSKYLSDEEPGMAGLFKSENKDVQVSLFEKSLDFVLGKRGWRSIPIGFAAGAGIAALSSVPIVGVGTYGLAGAAALGLTGVKWFRGKAFIDKE